MNQIQQFTETFIGVALVGSFAALVVIMAIMWLFLPFAVYGIKKRLDSIAGTQAQIAAATHRSNLQRLEIAKHAQRQPETP